jgi:hypothetical protein
MSHQKSVNRTIFPHRKVHKFILICPEGKTQSEIDYISIDGRRLSVLNV